MTDSKPIRLAILWHMHQPNYQEPGSNRMVMPWVRLHALKDYVDMPLIAAGYEGIKTTFNLVPSLLDQLDLYVDGGSDPHLELSGIRAEDLTEPQKKEILDSFFSANSPTMIEPFDRYRELYRKARSSHEQKTVPALFSSEEMRDLQVWSNLCWVDPLYHDEDLVRSLLEQGRHFREDQKQALLDWQRNLIGRTQATYQALHKEGKIDVSFTPYYHPILPLLCDTNVALEAMPKVTLPKKRFVHPEDARFQIKAAIDKYESLFGESLKGMWPSEGSVSEEVAQLLIEAGIKWIATDEEILYGSLKKSNVVPEDNFLPTVYDYGPGLRIFFRDHLLSDRIGFVYSGWDADRAVTDFIEQMKRIRKKHLNRLDQIVVSVILDGENAWEYFQRDGHDFLHEWYRRLAEDPLIELVTMTEAAENIDPKPLKSLFAGSWINHNFRIWIGHPEDNAAWDLLSATRSALVEFETAHPDTDREILKKAWQQIYIAEGSDWCWWYGDEHRGRNNEQFDHIFRRHLIAVYEYLGLEVPFELLNPIYQSGTVYESQLPDALLTPRIDGCISHFYEWSGAGLHDSLAAGEAMHRVERYAARLFYAYDHENLHIRLDFVDKKSIELLKAPEFRITFSGENPLEITIAAGADHEGTIGDFGAYALDEILELSISRGHILPKGYGEVEFSLAIFDGDKKLEMVPLNSTIKFEVSEKNKELFWPV